MSDNSTGTEDTGSAYATRITRVGEHYLPLMVARLNRLAPLLDGYRTSVYEMINDEFSAWLTATRPGESEPAFDVTITLQESHHYGDGFDGVTFSLDVVEYGGLLIGGFSPYNYTSQCWVFSDEDIKNRWQFLDDADDADIVELITNHFKTRTRVR